MIGMFERKVQKHIMRSVKQGAIAIEKAKLLDSSDLFKEALGKMENDFHTYSNSAQRVHELVPAQTPEQ